MNSNRGMYIEELVIKTINYLCMNELAHIEKRNLPINLTKKEKNKVSGYLLKKSYIDFFGCIEGKYIDFETKQTNNNYFTLDQIKEHQFKHMVYINSIKGVSFLIVHFYNNDKTFLVDYNTLEKWSFRYSRFKQINIQTFESEAYELTVIFPGILNLLEVIKKTMI